MNTTEGINQDLDDILDGFQKIYGFRPVFHTWAEHDGSECRVYRMKNGAYSKLVTIETETAITDHFWIDE